MPQPAGGTTTYSSNEAHGDSTNIYGNVYGDVHFPERRREAGELSPHQCLRDLRVTDPREDRARIEGDKDRLLRDCYGGRRTHRGCCGSRATQAKARR
jgi:hypothetical protein